MLCQIRWFSKCFIWINESWKNKMKLNSFAFVISYFVTETVLVTILMLSWVSPFTVVHVLHTCVICLCARSFIITSPSSCRWIMVINWRDKWNFINTTSLMILVFCCLIGLKAVAPFSAEVQQSLLSKNHIPVRSLVYLYIMFAA